MTLGRSLAHSGCKFLLCTVEVLGRLCRGPAGSQALGGQPDSRAIFTGLWAATALFLESEPRRCKEPEGRAARPLPFSPPGPEAGRLPPASCPGPVKSALGAQLDSTLSPWPLCALRLPPALVHTLRRETFLFQAVCKVTEG